MRNGPAFAAAYNVEGVSGLIVYQIVNDATLEGIWTIVGPDGNGTEVLSPRSQPARRLARGSRLTEPALSPNSRGHLAGVAELVDAPDSKSGSARSVGSIPTTRTIQVCRSPGTIFTSFTASSSLSHGRR